MPLRRTGPPGSVPICCGRGTISRSPASAGWLTLPAMRKESRSRMGKRTETMIALITPRRPHWGAGGSSPLSISRHRRSSFLLQTPCHNRVQNHQKGGAKLHQNKSFLPLSSAPILHFACLSEIRCDPPREDKVAASHRAVAVWQQESLERNRADLPSCPIFRRIATTEGFAKPDPRPEAESASLRAPPPSREKDISSVQSRSARTHRTSCWTS